MHGVLPAQAQRAIFPDVQSYSDKKSGAQSCGSVENQWFASLVRALFTAKPGATLHYLTQAPERTCQAYASGSRDPSADFFVRLLRSAEGGRVLAYVMRGSNLDWWQRHQLAEIHLKAREAYDVALNEAAAQLELGL